MAQDPAPEREWGCGRPGSLSGVRRWLVLGLALVCLGCPPSGKSGAGGNKGGTASGGPAAAKAELKGLLAPALGGWMGRMARRPKEFSRLTAGSPGWNALWSGELSEAVSGFEESLEDEPDQLAHRVGAARAALELGTFHASVAAATADLTTQYVRERDRRRAKIGPITPLETLYAGVAALLTTTPDPASAKARLEALSASTAPDAKPLIPAARAWLGLAEHLGGQAEAAEAAWQQAVGAKASDPNAELLVAYLRARAGLPLPAELPSGDGSPYARSLRWSTLVRKGERAEALRTTASLDLRAPHHSVRLKAPVAAEGGGEPGAAEERAKLDFYGPFAMQEQARLHLARAAALLVDTPGPGGCGAYWRGRALQALGDTKGALAAYGAVKGGGCEPTAPVAPGTGAPPAPKALGSDDPVSCLVLTPFASIDEMAADARLRAASLQGQDPPAVAAGTSWVTRLDNLLARARRGAKIDLPSELGFVPEDLRVLEAALETHFEGKVPEKGVTALLRGRFFEHHVHGLASRKARIATASGETRLAIKTYDALHDNTKPDELSTLNRPGYLLETALARWRNNDPQGTAVLLNVLWKRYPGVWPASEFVRRIRAVHALENIGSNVPISGQ